MGPSTGLDALEKRKLSLSHQDYKPNSCVVQLAAFNCPGCVSLEEKCGIYSCYIGVDQDAHKHTIVDSGNFIPLCIVLLCMITLRNFVVLTFSVRYVILFWETGVVHRITYSFNYFFFFVVLFTKFILDIK